VYFVIKKYVIFGDMYLLGDKQIYSLLPPWLNKICLITLVIGWLSPVNMDLSTEQVPSIRTASKWNGTLSSCGWMQRISPGTRCWVNISFSVERQRCLFSNNLLYSLHLPTPPRTTVTLSLKIWSHPPGIQMKAISHKVGVVTCFGWSAIFLSVLFDWFFSVIGNTLCLSR
jgi:hypothetical protein